MSMFIHSGETFVQLNTLVKSPKKKFYKTSSNKNSSESMSMFIYSGETFIQLWGLITIINPQFVLYSN